jgi:hypothetical protein
MWVPWIAGLAAKPLVSLSECAKAELGYQHRSCFVEAFDDGRVLVDRLLLKSSRTPSGWVSLHGKQVLGTPR